MGEENPIDETGQQQNRFPFIWLLIFPMEVVVMRPRYVQGEFDFSRAAGSARASRSSGS